MNANMMNNPGVLVLMLGGAFSAAASLAHLACIVIGAPAYRFMGAGDRMARAAASGKLRPMLITSFIATLLGAWAALAFAGAGLGPRLPYTKFALVLIGTAYLLRAVCFPWLRRVFPENSERFWWISSGLCAAIGSLYITGAVAAWATL